MPARVTIPARAEHDKPDRDDEQREERVPAVHQIPRRTQARTYPSPVPKTTTNQRAVKFTPPSSLRPVPEPDPAAPAQ